MTSWHLIASEAEHASSREKFSVFMKLKNSIIQMLNFTVGCDKNQGSVRSLVPINPLFQMMQPGLRHGIYTHVYCLIKG